MKKVSVQFNLVVDDDWTHINIRNVIKRQLEVLGFRKITSIQINDINKKG